MKVNTILEQMDVDLMDVSRQTVDNDGVRFVLVAVDVLSKFALVRTLNTKRVAEVASAAKEIFDERKPQSICTDRGKEWSGEFQDLLKNMGIRHFYAQGSTHCTIVERFIRTLRGKIARYQYKNNTDRYVDVLQDLVKNYNHSFHRTIKMRPVDVTELNDHEAYANIRKSQKKRTRALPYQFKEGDQVRISGAKHPFRREFFQRWSEEVFVVFRRYRRDNINMFKIKDCTGEEVQGTFYADEIKLALGDRYIIEKVLDEKKENGIKYVKVLWRGFPKKCAQWILKSDILPSG